MGKIFTSLLLALTFTACQGQKINLAFNLQQGKEYKLVVNTKTTIIQEFNGQKSNMVMGVKGSMLYKVDSVNPSDYDLEVQYESLSMAMDLPQGKIEFNSAKNDEQDVLSTILSGMVGNPFHVTMSKNGKILEVKNFESTFEPFFEDLPHMRDDQKEQFKAQINKAFGAEALKSSIEMATAFFPEQPVNKGDKWTVKTKLETGMAGLMTTEYELTELGSNYVKIRGNSVIVTEDKEAYIESNGMPMKYDLTGSMISEIKINRESGWIIEANINQDIEGDAYIQKNPQMPEGMKIPMKSKNETTLRGE